MAKKLTTLYLDVEQEEKLKKLSVTTRVPKAVYTREASIKKYGSRGRGNYYRPKQKVLIC